MPDGTVLGSVRSRPRWARCGYCANPVYFSIFYHRSGLATISQKMISMAVKAGQPNANHHQK